MHICGLTFDRYIRVLHALKYVNIVTNKRCKRFIASAWLLAFVGSFVQFCWLYPIFIDSQWSGEEEYEALNRVEVWYSAIAFFIFMFIPLTFVMTSYTMIYTEIGRMRKRQRRRSIGSIDNRMQRHALYTYTALFIMFLLLSFPYFMVRLLMDLSTGFQYTVNISIEATSCITLLKYMTSLMNPIGAIHKVCTPKMRIF